MTSSVREFAKVLLRMGCLDPEEQAFTDSIKLIESRDAELVREASQAATAAAYEKAADAITAKHHADFQIGVCQAREIVLALITPTDANALAEHDKEIRRDERDFLVDQEGWMTPDEIEKLVAERTRRERLEEAIGCSEAAKSLRSELLALYGEDDALLVRVVRILGKRVAALRSPAAKDSGPQETTK